MNRSDDLDASVDASPRLRAQPRLAPYSWLTLLQAFITTGVAFGVWFSFAVFFVALLESFDWSRGDASLAFSIGNLLQAALAPLVGALTDRAGPRRMIALGLALMALGLAACSQVQTLWHFLVLFGLVVGGGVALCGPIPHSALLATWFARQRGAIIGFAFAGMGIGVMVMGPLAQRLILDIGWRSSFLVLAVGVAIYTVIAALTLRNHPHEVGLAIYGASEPQWSAARGTCVEPAPRQWTVGEAVCTREFWALSIVQILIPVGIFPISTHQVAYVVDAGFSKVMAAAILGQMSLMSACGRVLFGVMSDRLGRFGGVTLSVLCSQLGIVALLSLDGASTAWPLYAYAVFLGWAMARAAPLLAPSRPICFPGVNLRPFLDS